VLCTTSSFHISTYLHMADEESSNASSIIWLGVYFILNISLTIYNKYVMQFTKFKYPWTLTSIHTLFTSVGCLIFALLGAFKPTKSNWRKRAVLFGFSLLYTLNIAVTSPYSGQQHISGACDCAVSSSCTIDNQRRDNHNELYAAQHPVFA
jgi:hypothetical protein